MDPKENESDWVYADDALVVIYIHTGCDVRGGYGQPVFLRSSNSSYAMQALDWCHQFYAVEGADEDGEALDDSELQSICEKWQNGYSAHAGQLSGRGINSGIRPGLGAG